MRLVKPNSLLEAFELAKEFVPRLDDSQHDKATVQSTWCNNVAKPTCSAKKVLNQPNLSKT